jgi:hypothetical protein
MSYTNNLWGNNLNLYGNAAVAGGLTVAGPLTTAGGASKTPVQLSAAGLVSIPATGFFETPASGTSGAGGFTGSFPSPATFPGGEVFIVDTASTYPYLLTGTFSMTTFVSGSSAPNAATATGVTGTKITVSAGGTITLVSDATDWLVLAVRGTATLAP